MEGFLELKNGLRMRGTSYGARRSVAGEVVFTTGMSGYVEALTDPSYRGQILVFTYPLMGNYGVPEKSKWESARVQAAGVVVASYVDTPSHPDSKMSLGEWLAKEGVPMLEIKDTRFLAEEMRMYGTLLGKMMIGENISWSDPNERNLVAEVSTEKIEVRGEGGKHILLLDCGAKENIVRELLSRKTKVSVAPWNYDPFAAGLKFDALVISNGPGNPKKVPETIQIVREALERKVPMLGICLGNQILALAAGGDTYKLKFGHRGQNQPCFLAHSEKAYLTTQNHGYSVGRVPRGFKEWFKNGNDGTNEGLIHQNGPYMSVQFHPEAAPGPEDTSWIFDYFLDRIK